jgi:hypothetical protein
MAFVKTIMMSQSVYVITGGLVKVANGLTRVFGIPGDHGVFVSQVVAKIDTEAGLESV